MLQVARLAPNLLLEAGDRVVEFLHGQINADGGGKDRSGESDLYYTVFCIEGLVAMRADLPADRICRYLSTFGTGEDLDFVHLCCLAPSVFSSGSAVTMPGIDQMIGVRERITPDYARFRTRG